MQKAASVAVVELSPPTFLWTKDEMISGVGRRLFGIAESRGRSSMPILRMTGGLGEV
jgi:hypothetical protein